MHIRWPSSFATIDALLVAISVFVVACLALEFMELLSFGWVFSLVLLSTAIALVLCWLSARERERFVDGVYLKRITRLFLLTICISCGLMFALTPKKPPNPNPNPNPTSRYINADCGDVEVLINQLDEFASSPNDELYLLLVKFSRKLERRRTVALDEACPDIESALSRVKKIRDERIEANTDPDANDSEQSPKNEDDLPETPPEGAEPPAEDVEPPAEDVEPPAEDVEPPAEDVEPPAEDVEPPNNDDIPNPKDVTQDPPDGNPPDDLRLRWSGGTQGFVDLLVRLISGLGLGPTSFTSAEIAGAIRSAQEAGSSKPFEKFLEDAKISELAKSTVRDLIDEYLRANPKPSDDDAPLDAGLRLIGKANNRDICHAIIYYELQTMEYKFAKLDDEDLVEEFSKRRDDSKDAWDEFDQNLKICFSELAPEGKFDALVRSYMEFRNR